MSELNSQQPAAVVEPETVVIIAAMPAHAATEGDAICIDASPPDEPVYVAASGGSSIAVADLGDTSVVATTHTASSTSIPDTACVVAGEPAATGGNADDCGSNFEPIVLD